MCHLELSLGSGLSIGVSTTSLFSRDGHQLASGIPSTDAGVVNILTPFLTDPAKISLGWMSWG